MNFSLNVPSHIKIVNIIKIIILVAILLATPFAIMAIKVPSHAFMEQPWNKSNLKVYIDTTQVPADVKDIYTYNGLIAFRWWEHEGKNRLGGYQVNFTEVNAPSDANIIINWTEKLYNKENILGHTYINTTNQLGDPTCDTYHPPFTRCNITIKLNLDDATMQRVIEHEIGHTFTFQHSFNARDYIVSWFGQNYLNSPSDIMFDGTLIDLTTSLYILLLIFLLGVEMILLGYFMIKIYNRKRKK